LTFDSIFEISNQNANLLLIILGKIILKNIIVFAFNSLIVLSVLYYYLLDYFSYANISELSNSIYF
jgi:hypothetical protein